MLYGTPFGTSACGKLFKRSLFTGVEFPYGKFSEDLFTIYKTILKSENVTYVGFVVIFTIIAMREASSFLDIRKSI